MTETAQKPKPRRGRVSRSTDNRLVVSDIHNVIVLVAGTTSPGNLGTDSRAQDHSIPGEVSGDASYWGEFDGQEKAPAKFNDDSWYWADNTDFRRALVELTQRYTNLHLFRVHGWSGDNSPDNRRIAGAYLARRLCMATRNEKTKKKRESGYYAGWRDKPVAFHLIGHSHGGNLINEFTKQAAALENWPKKWKIRSITYLSTPFFTQLHQVDTKRFDPECKILNVHCEYDLTQRVVADFSLLPLFLVLEQSGAQRVMDASKKIAFDLKKLQEHLLHAVKNARMAVQTDWEEILRDLVGIGKKRFVDAFVAAFPLYDELMRLLKAIADTLTEARATVNQLRTPIWFPVAKEIDGEPKNERVVLEDALAARLDGELARLHQGLMRAHGRLQARRNANEKDILFREVMDDIDMVGDVLQPLVTFAAIDRDTLSGPLIDIVGDILTAQIDVFDNTRRSPEEQLRGTPFASRIVNLDVTKHDDFSRVENRKFHPGFVQKLEAAERRYEQSKRRRDLIDLVLVLGAQQDFARLISTKYTEYEGKTQWGKWAGEIAGYLEEIMDEEQNRLFRALRDFVNQACNWAQLLRDRDAGGLEVTTSTEDPKLGSLLYLMKKSHSVSRQNLYPPVSEALQSQLSTRLRRAVR